MKARYVVPALIVIVVAVVLIVVLPLIAGGPIPPTPQDVLAQDGYTLLHTYSKGSAPVVGGVSFSPYLAVGHDTAALGQKSDGSAEVVFRIKQGFTSNVQTIMPQVESYMGAGSKGRIYGPYLVIDVPH